MNTLKIKIKGMRSAACVSGIEHTLQQLAGVQAVRVDLVTGEAMLRSYEPLALADVQGTVETAGFTIEEVSSKRSSGSRKAVDEFTKPLQQLMTVGLALLLLEAVAAFYKYQLAVPCVQVLAVVELLLILGVLYLGKKYITFGWQQLASGEPHIFSLLALTCGGALLHNLINLVMVLQGYVGDYSLYGAVLAALLFFTLRGEQQKQKVEQFFTHEEVVDFKLPKGTLLLDDEEHLLPGSSFFVGDVVLVREGSVIPVDGVIIDGEATVNECELTGSNHLLEKKKKQQVLAESVVVSGSLKIRATAVDKDVQAVQLWRLAKSYAKEPKAMQRITHSSNIAAVYLPLVLGVGVAAALSWYIYSGDFTLGWKIMAGVLLGAYPYALGMAQNGAVLNVCSLAAAKGVTFKSLAVLEQLKGISLLAVPQEQEPNVMDLVGVAALNVNGESLYDPASDKVKRVNDLQSKDKAELVQSLRQSGEHVLVLGSKLCDMPALASGDIAVAEQSSAAEQFAQIVVPKDGLQLLPDVLALSVRVNQEVKRNIRLALIFNICSLPVTIGLAKLLGGVLFEPLYALVWVALGGCVLQNLSSSDK